MDVLIIYKNNVTTSMALSPMHIKQVQESIDGSVFWCETEADALSKKIDAEVLVFWGGGKPSNIPVRWCQQSKKLRWVHILSSGFEPVEKSPIWQLPVPFTNTRGIHGKVIAFTVLGYITAFMRQLPRFYRLQLAHHWERPLSVIPSDPDNLTACIIGAGSIGSEIAKTLHSLSIYTIGVKRHVSPLPFFDDVYDSDHIKEAVSGADFIILSVPLTDSTFHMVDEALISHLKPTAFLINISRGSVVDETALIKALKTKQISGAAIDVAEIEPLSEHSPLWELDNIIITPHMAAVSNQYLTRAIDQLCMNISRFRNGLPLLNEVKSARN